jgi:hypothetical protein
MVYFIIASIFFHFLFQVRNMTDVEKLNIHLVSVSIKLIITYL